MGRSKGFLCVAFVFFLTSLGRADNTAFDLAGPIVDIKVTRGDKILPISKVPNLQPGDRLWLHPDLPANQSIHYLLVAAFLRGATDSPPDIWFTKAETWKKPVSEEGVYITVPRDAQQVVLFLAPESGGDFGTLRKAVKDKPGAFVRASQDLMQASLDRLRLDHYLHVIRRTSNTEPQALHDRTVLMARSLSIRLDQQCFDKPTQEQAPCLTRNTEQLVLDDAQSQSMVATLTSGASSDLIGQITNSRLAGGGVYSAYVGAVVDVVRIMGNLHTPQFRYIPALALPQQDRLALKLNNPPSFRKPKSVLVVGLPAVQPAQVPSLRPVEPNTISCLQKSDLVLPVEGSPLIFASEYGHDFVLRLKDKAGTQFDIPITPDAARGGFVVDPASFPAGKFDRDLSGTIVGQWGFQPFEGPSFQLRNALPAKWLVASSDPSTLVVGRENTLRLQSDAAVCVDDVTTEDEQGVVLKTDWKMVSPTELEVQLGLKDVTPGPLTMMVKQFAMATPDPLPLQSFSEGASLDRFSLHAGDQQGTLEGRHLQEVTTLELRGVRFSPAGLEQTDQKDVLRLSAPNNQSVAGFKPGDQFVARVTLNDGRVLDLTTTVKPPRPQLSLLSKSVQPSNATQPVSFRLSNPNDLPQDGRLSFFLKSQVPDSFARTEKVEIAAADGSFRATLTVSAGDLVMQDAQTVLAILDPLRSLGPSAFGPLRFRPVDETGAAGDWQPLINLVRIPNLKEIRCPENPDKACTLRGTNLFLIDSLSTNSKFSRPVSVPAAYVDSTLSVPRPSGTLLYVKLRDDPGAVNRVSLPVLPDED
ncbi:MAG: hypothetical protein JST79_01800 [Acidobacteria bacterium]|nr:hypothetical protein [Acidobacteriota bacterium]